MTNGTKNPIKPGIHPRIMMTRVDLITLVVTMPVESKLGPPTVSDCWLDLFG